VTAINRGDLHDRYAEFFNLISVLAGRCVAVEHGYTTLAFKFFDELCNQCGLTGTNRAHEIDRGDTMLIEQRPIFAREFFVLF
jgi:hypothetical protein